MSMAMTQMIHDIMGVVPKEVDILTDQEVVFKPILYNRSVQSNTRVVSLGRSISHGG